MAAVSCLQAAALDQANDTPSAVRTPTVAEAHSPELLRGGAGAVAPPPGLSMLEEGAPQPPPVVEDMTGAAVAFAAALRDAPLPKDWNGHTGERAISLKDIAHRCIVGMYHDRVVPCLGELRCRMHSVGCSPADSSFVLQVCAHYTEDFVLAPPTDSIQPRVFLRQSPPGFLGWVPNTDSFSLFPASVWQEFRRLLSSRAVSTSGSPSSVAEALRAALPTSVLGQLSLGERRQLVALALRPQKGLLAYDPVHGGRLLALEGPEELLSDGASSAACAAAGADTPVEIDPDTVLPTLLEALAQQDTFGAGGFTAQQPELSFEELQAQAQVAEYWIRVASVVHCAQSFYFRREEPSLEQLKERLERDYFWNGKDCHFVLDLCSRHPELFQTVPPATATGQWKVHVNAPQLMQFGVAGAWPGACAQPWEGHVHGGQAADGAGQCGWLAFGGRGLSPMVDTTASRKIFTHI